MFAIWASPTVALDFELSDSPPRCRHSPPRVVVRGCGRVDLSRVQSKTRGEPRPDDKNSSSFGARLGANTLPLCIYNPQRRSPLAKVHRLQRSDAPLIGSFRIGTTFSN